MRLPRGYTITSSQRSDDGLAVTFDVTVAPWRRTLIVAQAWLAILRRLSLKITVGIDR